MSRHMTHLRPMSVLLSPLLLAACGGASSGAPENTTPTEISSEADVDVEVENSVAELADAQENGEAIGKVEVTLDDVPAPASAYVVWMESAGQTRRLGAMSYDAESQDARFEGPVDATEFRLVVTVEGAMDAASPVGRRVAEADCEVRVVDVPTAEPPSDVTIDTAGSGAGGGATGTGNLTRTQVLPSAQCDMRTL